MVGERFIRPEQPNGRNNRLGRLQRFRKLRIRFRSVRVDKQHIEGNGLRVVNCKPVNDSRQHASGQRITTCLTDRLFVDCRYGDAPRGWLCAHDGETQIQGDKLEAV